jgi:hypothetical protein
VLIERTKSAHVRIWCALLRSYLSPHKLIVKSVSPGMPLMRSANSL